VNDLRHRGGFETEEKYRGIPAHAFPGVHEMVLKVLLERLSPGAKIADIGAGHGALSQRLLDNGFEVTAFDLDCSDWLASEVSCYQCNLDKSLEPIAAHGPFDAICVLEVIDHLENPRSFLRDLRKLARPAGSTLVMTMPNPLDTFSCIAMFTRGIFSWAGPAQYLGGGHISILPHWLIEAHLRYIGITEQDWLFLAPYRHPTAWKRWIYGGLSQLRRLMARSARTDFFEGQTALLIARI